MRVRDEVRGFAPQLGAAVPVLMLILVVLSVILTAAETLELSPRATSSWILALLGIPAALSVVTSFLWRQPYLWTGHLLAVILFASLADQATFPELVAATMVAGVVVVVLAAAGVTGLVTGLIPAPVVMGLIAGVVAPFVWRLFTALGSAPAVVGSVLVAYVASQRLLGTRVPPIFSALVAGVVATGATGQFGAPPPGPTLPDPILYVPEFSLDVIAATVPIVVVLMTLQTNVPWVIYLRAQGYAPPERLINVAGGATTLVGSILGPMAVSLGVGAVALVGGPDAGRREHRYRVVLIVAAVVILVALGSTTAAPLASFVPPQLIVAIAGLALLGILVAALADVVRGPLQLGPVVTFAVVLSDISLLGLGPFFWSLALGTAVSFILEREGWDRLRGPIDSPPADRTLRA